mgnify:CR=1 FL=1
MQCCAELSLSCAGHRRGHWGWPGRAGRQLSLPTAASCWAPLLRLGGIKLLEAAMCHQGPTASHFKSVNLLFFKLVTLALLSSYTTLNGRSSGRRTHIGHKQQRERKILFIKLDIMDRGWVLHTPGPASCTGWQSTRWYHPCTPEIWNQDSGGKTSLYFTVIIVSHSISRGLGNIEQTPLRKSATYSRKKASKFNVSYFFSFSILLTCCSVTSSVIKASRSSITTLHRSQLRLFESLTVSMSSTLEPATLNSILVSHILIY